MNEPEEHTEPPFYGHDIIRRNEQKYIQNLLKKYEKDPVNDELKKKIWEDLQIEKYYGRITIPFKIAMRCDPTGKFPDYIEVILDTQV